MAPDQLPQNHSVTIFWTDGLRDRRAEGRRHRTTPLHIQRISCFRRLELCFGCLNHRSPVDRSGAFEVERDQ